MGLLSSGIAGSVTRVPTAGLKPIVTPPPATNIAKSTPASEVSPDQDATAKKGVLSDIFNAPANSLLGVIKNTIAGIPKAANDLFNPITGKLGQEISAPVNTDIGNTPGQKPLVPDNSALGIGANTVLGTIGTLTKGLQTGVSRDVLGGTVGSIPALTQGQGSFTPNDPISKFLYGTAPVPNMYESGRQQMLNMGVGPKTAAVMGLPFGLMTAATDLTLGEQENPIRLIASSEDPALIEKTIASEYPALKEQAPVLAKTLAGVKDPQQVSSMLRDAIKQKTAEALSQHPQSPDITYEPTPETAPTSSVEPAIQQGPPTEEHSQPLTSIPDEQARENPLPPEDQQITKTQPQDLPPFPEQHAEADTKSDQIDPSYKASISENNGGIEPPTNAGGMRVPEIDFSTGKDRPAIDLSVNTMERNIENIFPRETAKKINGFLIDSIRANEADRVKYVSNLREQVKSDVVDKLGIHVGSKESMLLQRYGEGRMTLSELMKEAPKKADAIIEANSLMRKIYDDLLDHWNEERANAGLAPVAKRSDYFRHFQDMHSWMSMFNFMAKRPELPTAISGITENFRSRVPWASAAMRRLGGPFTEDAIKGLDQYLNTTSRAIFHTDSVQRGRLFEKYLREAADARTSKGLPDVGLPNFASNLNDWVNLISGKQAKLDRAIESVAGRQVLPVLSALTRRFSKNVIGGSFSSAITHAIPTVFTLATTDTRAAVLGLLDTLRSPFTDDFTEINGLKSGFLTRRFGTDAIEKNVLEKGSDILGSPFHAVDQFISRFAVSAKYAEGVKAGLSPEEAMAAADKYAARTIGDRSTGNLPNLMNTKTLGMITQFQIEVNDNLQVLLHDIPYDQHGNATKIAGMYVKFAIYSYMFNQIMQNVKGSGKGLDPIDLGLTLAGLNEEGKGKDLATRAGLAGTDFAKELPFTSVVTGGQIPALQPLEQAGTEAMSGDIAGAGKQLGVDYVSPIGGGVQAEKTFEGISAVNNGETTNSKGQLVASIPQTPTNYVKGALFGTAAFPEQRAATQKQSELYQLLQQGKNGSQTVKAIQTYDDLKNIADTQGPDAANAKYEALKESDPALAKLVLTQASNEKLGLTKEQMMIKQLGVGSGARARYLAEQFNNLPDAASKSALWEKYVADKIITPQVATQLTALLQK